MTYALKESIREASMQTPLAYCNTDNRIQDTNTIYLNPAQKLVVQMGCRTVFIRGSRGLGKTSMAAIRLAYLVQTQPRGTFLFIGLAFSQLYSRTMPSLIKSLEQILHWKEGIQFFRGHAPAGAHFPEPLTKPRSWTNCLHFYNGAVLYLVSLSVSGSANGMNVNGLIGDECRFYGSKTRWEKLKSEIFPTLRGDVYDHPGWSLKNPYYLSMMFMSDAGVSYDETYWEEEENTQTEEVNDKICEYLAMLQLAEEEGWSKELLATPKFTAELNALRCQSRVFYNFSSVENLSVLGEHFINEMRRDMPDLLFRIQIMGQRRSKSADGFYHNFSVDLHTYEVDGKQEMSVINNSYTTKVVTHDKFGHKYEYEAPDLNRLGGVNDCSLDVDCLPNEPLYITIDYNKKINTMIIAQRYKMNGRDSCVILKSMYVQNGRYLEDLCGDVHNYFAPHQKTNRRIIYYYNQTAKANMAYASKYHEQFRFFNIVHDQLCMRGWDVQKVDMKQTVFHEVKFELINKILAGGGKFVVRINRGRNDYLIASLENSRLVYGKNGPRKDKSTEKKPNRTEDEQAEDTDMSDAFDDMIIGMSNYPQGSNRFLLTDIPLSGADVWM